MFELIFDVENDSFIDPFYQDELDMPVIAEVINMVAERVADGELRGIVRDHNGNRVGFFKFADNQ